MVTRRLYLVSLVVGVIFLFYIFSGSSGPTKEPPVLPAKWQDPNQSTRVPAKQTVYPSISLQAPIPFELDTSDLSVKWNSSLDSLLKLATDQTAVFPSDFTGFPGTGVSSNEEATALQQYLDCVVSKGSWVYEPDGGESESMGGAGLTVHKHSSILGACDKKFYKSSSTSSSTEWNVRSSLKWRWIPSESCSQNRNGFSPPPNLANITPLSRTGLCRLLRGKSIVLAGDTPSQYLLHDLILDWTKIRAATCYGDLYCAQHSICDEEFHDVIEPLRNGSPLTPTLSSAISAIETWYQDVTSYSHLPPPLHPSIHSPLQDDPDAEYHALNAAEKLEKRATIPWTYLRYRRSDSVAAYAGSIPNRFDPEFVHPYTGIREMNTAWTADAKRSDLVILHKSPLPLPLPGHNKEFDDVIGDRTPGQRGERAALRILEAAVKITKDVWLPEMLQMSKYVRGTTESGYGTLLVYRGGWLAQPDCYTTNSSASRKRMAQQLSWAIHPSPGDGPLPFPSLPLLEDLVYVSDDRTLSSISTLFYNFQTALQNEIARQVFLPHFRIPYIDTSTLTSIWRSGMVGATVPAPQDSFGLRKGAQADCFRYCLPSPGMALEHAFIGSLTRLLEWGWGTEERRERWGVVGSKFKSLRDS